MIHRPLFATEKGRGLELLWKYSKWLINIYIIPKDWASLFDSPIVCNLLGAKTWKKVFVFFLGESLGKLNINM